MQSTDTIFNEVKALLAEYQGVEPETISMETSLANDCGMAGDDAYDFFTELDNRYQIDFEGLNLGIMFGDEGFGMPLPFNIHNSYWFYKIQPCYVADVVTAVKIKRWGKTPLVQKTKKELMYTYLLSLLFNPLSFIAFGCAIGFVVAYMS